MANPDFQTFTDNYSEKDFDAVKMKGNGLFGASFADENIDFRMELCEYLLPQIQSVKIDLIRDLYCEIGKQSKYTFGIYLKFGVLAQELLERGGTNYLLDYIKGTSQSMDAGIMSGNINLSKERAKELLYYFNERKEISENSEELALLDGFIKQRLEWLIKKAATQQ